MSITQKMEPEARQPPWTDGEYRAAKLALSEIVSACWLAEADGFCASSLVLLSRDVASALSRMEMDFKDAGRSTALGGSANERCELIVQAVCRMMLAVREAVSQPPRDGAFDELSRLTTLFRGSLDMTDLGPGPFDLIH